MKPIFVVRHDGSQLKTGTDIIALETSLTLDLVYGPIHNRSHHPLTTIMRTPGHDHYLAIGLLFSLGIIAHVDDVLDIIPCARGKTDDNGHERLTILLAYHRPFLPLDFVHGYPRFSSCGLCGSYQLPLAHQENTPGPTLKISPSLLTALPEKMSLQQTIFNQTGGVHAAAIFTSTGELLSIFEDIGRHNALDKLIGHALRHNVAMTSSILMLSSRASFEILQKAARAGITLVAVMGAVSSLAVNTAEESGITLVGFVRNHRLNIYTHATRVYDCE